MEDLLIPLISFLLIIGSSALKSRSDSNKQANKKTPNKTQQTQVQTQTRVQNQKDLKPYSPKSIFQTLKDLEQSEEYKEKLPRSKRQYTEYSPYGKDKETVKMAANETKDSQLEDLRDKLAVDTATEANQKVRAQRQQMDKVLKDLNTIKTKKKINNPVYLKKQLTSNGLKRSIIMAEVLSPPRAKQPYGTRKI